MDPHDWQVPDLNIVYSRGAPTGRTLGGREVFFDVMVDTFGQRVPCTESHSTCLLRNDRKDWLQYASPTKDIFCRTAAYLTALRRLGCSRPLAEPTPLSLEEEEAREVYQIYIQQVRRGHRTDGTCEGKILFRYDSHNHPHVYCQHYNKKTGRDHFHDDSVGKAVGAYDLNYIEAELSGDKEEVEKIEQAAFDLGYGPQVECTTVVNASSQRAHCPHDHRNDSGLLVQPLMERLSCAVKIRVIEPLEEYRQDCPYVAFTNSLITSDGPHTHPIPLPTKKPPTIRSEVFELLEKLGDDIPDITARGFLRHPVVKAFLRKRFPHNPNPTLSHLHTSLANRSRLKAYIKQFKFVHCPHGTGWDAILHLKQQQDTELPACEHYIRRRYILDPDTMDHHEEDNEELMSKDKQLRIIICMSPIASHRLLRSGSYLQSDIAFQRVTDFLEFELACMDRDANTSLIFCRVFLNRQTAVAHQKIFSAIEDIVYEDTGKRLRWRHLHGADLEDFEGLILQWGADQHRGQAKGLGLHLQAVAASLPQRFDLYQPHRTIQSLSPYDHLHRVFRLCSNHFYRNITSSAATTEIKWLMRSLLCVEHADWEGTVSAIEQNGGKVGRDWIKDKQTTHFVFEAICWERSHIPLSVWKAGDSHTNLVETVHRDANREGVQCTLLGGLQKGQAFDSLKMRTLELYEMYGVQSTYMSGHISENAFRNMRRRDSAKRRTLLAADQKIEIMNTKLQKSYDALQKA
ncbi:hypothetical protein K438DRAFT_1630265 [Mycena galopus ATCC 62051]|nr:hypothetical protein K438DRAFT_1630265 [Mycena galopus ATCC 62051]